MEAFNADVQLLPQWVQIWVNILGGVAVVSAVLLLIGRETRMLGVWSLVALALIVPAMVWLHGQMGMVRLLGIVHLVFWTPLVWLMWQRLRTNPPGRFYSAVLSITVLILGISLLFDLADVVRWLMGDRALLV